jgi:CHAT domain-containing protein
MLQRLMVELVAEESKVHETKVETALNEANLVRDAAKLDREKKKLEALERSKQRQANPEYFQQRVSANLEADATKAAKAAAIINMIIEEEEVEVVTEDTTNDDPFRSYTTKTKNKISVR